MDNIAGILKNQSLNSRSRGLFLHLWGDEGGFKARVGAGLSDSQEIIREEETNGWFVSTSQVRVS